MLIEQEQEQDQQRQRLQAIEQDQEQNLARQGGGIEIEIEGNQALKADGELKLPIMKFVEFDGKIGSRSNRRLK